VIRVYDHASNVIEPAAGATMKKAIRYGVARGLFSNESGLGSAPIVAAAAQTKNPVRQGLVSSTGTFWDTVVVCAMTGLVLVNSGEWAKSLKGAALTKAAFSDIHIVGPIILTTGLYDEKAAEYLFGTKVIKPYRWLWVVAVIVGSVLSLPTVWSLADITNGLMAIPNLISLIALNGVIVAEIRRYLWSNNLDEAAPPVTELVST
jgi:AGCS family alanine or glycine:cation symporter